MKKEEFLTAKEISVIDAAIKEAEAVTAGEIKVIIAQKSAPGNATDEEKTRAAEARAEKLFVGYGLTHTRDKTGILFLVSLDERRVVVRGGKAINEKVRQSDWDGHVRMIVEGIKTGNPGEGIADAVRAAGILLAREFPVKDDDINEITDSIVFLD